MSRGSVDQAGGQSPQLTKPFRADMMSFEASRIELVGGRVNDSHCPADVVSTLAIGNPAPEIQTIPIPNGHAQPRHFPPANSIPLGIAPPTRPSSISRDKLQAMTWPLP